MKMNPSHTRGMRRFAVQYGSSGVQALNIGGINVNARPTTKKTARFIGVNLKFQGWVRSKKSKVANRLRVRNRAGIMVAYAQANTTPFTNKSVGMLLYDHARAGKLKTS